MKKILFTLSAIALVSAAQAVTLAWNITSTGGNDNFNIADVKAVSIFTGTADTLTLSDWTTTTSGATLVGSLQAATGTSVTQNAYSWGASPTQQNYFIVLFDSSNNYVVSQAIAYDGTSKNGFIDAAPNGTLIPTGAWDGVNVGSWGTGANVAPEPTTTALLALGLAAVGLRRKVRK